MEIRILNKDDYDELLNLLNGVFANKYGRPMDFLSEQPRMWKRDDEHMGKHVGVYEDGHLVSVVGIYPLPVVIAGERLTFATTGNVATHPAYEGRGYFTKLFSIAMEEIDRIGVDVARLGGTRQRYARFGFEPGGSAFRIELNSTNRIKYFGDRGKDITFERVERRSAEALRYINTLVEKKLFHVERPSDNEFLDGYLLLGTKHSAAYVAKRGDEMIGYLSATCDAQYVGVGEFGRNITEYGYESVEDFLDMLMAYQRLIEKDLTITVAPHEAEILESLTDGAEYVNLVSPSRFKVKSFDKLTNALIKLKDMTEGLPFGEAVIEIEDYGRLRLYKNERSQGAEITDLPPEIRLTRAEATRLLYGHLPSFATKRIPESLKRFLPLPLSWNTLDYV